MGDVGNADTNETLIPYIKANGSGHQLIVDGKAFLVLAAELQNSSLSCPEYMRTVWSGLVDANINTVLGCVTWEAIEPEENSFDFSQLDKIIHDARRNGIRLVLLWFGAFKNGRSTYAPSWVKRNPERFPRALLRKAGGRLEPTEVLSIFHSSTCKADAKAFAALMRHLKDIDEQYSTVLMVQVENEVGLLGDSRDGSALAAIKFESSVPTALTLMLRERWHTLHPSLKHNLGTFRTRGDGQKHGSWTEVFGDSPQTDELFMAYHYAHYLEHVTAAGKAQFPLPMYTNVWQNYGDEDQDPNVPIVVGGGNGPGDYPSGGGVVNVLDIWRHFAPSLDMIAPDIYLNDYEHTCAKYKYTNQPLFIPEQRRDEYGARRIWSAYGSYGALGAAPFGIDTLTPASNPFKKHYGLLSQVSYYVLQAQSMPHLCFGFFFDELNENGQGKLSTKTSFGEWNLVIERSFVFGRPSAGFGMIVHLGGARFLLIGEGFQVRFSSRKPDAYFSGILSFKEKVVTDPTTGAMKDGRWLNGDETRSGEFVIMPSEDPDYGDFPISITIPARTRIAECEAYDLVGEVQ